MALLVTAFQQGRARGDNLAYPQLPLTMTDQTEQGPRFPRRGKLANGRQREHDSVRPLRGDGR